MSKGVKFHQSCRKQKPLSGFSEKYIGCGVDFDKPNAEVYTSFGEALGLIPFLLPHFVDAEYVYLSH